MSHTMKHTKDISKDIDNFFVMSNSPPPPPPRYLLRFTCNNSIAYCSTFLYILPGHMVTK